MQIIKVTPRGYCKGVVRAINIVKEVRASFNGPIYILGLIVHNNYVKRALEKYQVETLDLSKHSKEYYLDTISEGVLIFTAHGVSKKIYDKANKPNVKYIDASCLDVLKTQQIIKEKSLDGYHIVYIGKKNHPEAEAITQSYDNITLVTSIHDIELIPDKPKIYVTNQTTMSIYDTKDIQEKIKQKFPYAICDLEICDATKIRQEAIMNVQADILIIVGDPTSNNSNKLLELNTSIPNRYMINSVEDIQLEWFSNMSQVVAISSGASTPTYLTNQVIAYLEQLDLNNSQTFEKPKVDINKIL